MQLQSTYHGFPWSNQIKKIWLLLLTILVYVLQSFNLRRTVTEKPSTPAGPAAHVKVTAILEKANAIRQVLIFSFPTLHHIIIHKRLVVTIKKFLRLLVAIMAKMTTHGAMPDLRYETYFSLRSNSHKGANSCNCNKTHSMALWISLFYFCKL